MKIKDLLLYLLVIIFAIFTTHFFIYKPGKADDIDLLQTNWHKNPIDQLTVYSAKWCKACQATKKYLIDKNVEYTNIDIELNPDKNIFLKENNISSIPVITYNSQTIIGFDKDNLEKLLAKIDLKSSKY